MGQIDYILGLHLRISIRGSSGHFQGTSIFPFVKRCAQARRYDSLRAQRWQQHVHVVDTYGASYLQQAFEAPSVQFKSDDSAPDDTLSNTHVDIVRCHSCLMSCNESFQSPRRDCSKRAFSGLSTGKKLAELNPATQEVIKSALNVQRIFLAQPPPVNFYQQCAGPPF